MATNKQNQGGRSTSERTSQANRQNKQSSQKGEGRGWHGDPEGHAKAGSQSHKND